MIQIIDFLDAKIQLLKQSKSDAHKFYVQANFLFIKIFLKKILR